MSEEFPKSPSPLSDEEVEQILKERMKKVRKPLSKEKLQRARRTLYRVLLRDKKHYREGEGTSALLLSHVLGVHEGNIEEVMAGVEGFSVEQKSSGALYILTNRETALAVLRKLETKIE